MPCLLSCLLTGVKKIVAKLLKQQRYNIFLWSPWSESIKMSETDRRMLYNKVNNNCNGFLSKEVILLNNNMCPHSTAATMLAIRQLKSKLLPHAPHSLALAAMDYHMFRLLKTTCVMIKLRTWCTCGFYHNLKLSLHMGSEGLWNATQYVLKIGVILLRKDTFCIFYRLF